MDNSKNEFYKIFEVIIINFDSEENKLPDYRKLFNK